MKSFTTPAKVWHLKSIPALQAEILAAELNVPQWLARIFYHRGQLTLEKAQVFLNPKLLALTPPPPSADFAEALRLLLPLIKQGGVIGIAGDYDADGVTAVALLADFLKQCGAGAVWRLPNRLQEGYGFSVKAAEELCRAGAQAIITVDCGITDHAGVAAARQAGCPVIITDHHQLPPGALPAAQAIINPQKSASGLSAHLAGVGVAFYLAAALRAALKQDGYFNRRALPNLRNSLDLVALGSCADVVPLLDENRILVSEGIKVINSACRPGLRALIKAAKARLPLDARDVSFILAPRINAAGRLQSPDMALQLLLADCEEQAWPLAFALDSLNQQRRQLEAQIMEEAVQQLEQQQELPPCLVLASASWHKGVLGIVAGRLLEATGKPCLLLSLADGLAVGSGRSLPGFHLQQALTCADHLLDHYGGHALAAGLTMRADHLPQLDEILKQEAQKAASQMAALTLELEAEVRLADLTEKAMDMLERLGPYGQDNPEPVLLIKNLKVLDCRQIGSNQQHLKLNLEQGSRQVAALAFGQGGLAAQMPARIDAAATVRINSFGGFTRQELLIKEMRPAS